LKSDAGRAGSCTATSFAVNKAHGIQRFWQVCLNGHLYMRQTIETAPRDGKIVILEDDASGTYGVARWSAKAGGWVGENGEPSKIAPTHWHLRPRDEYFLQENDKSPRRFATLSITATLLAVGLMGLYLPGLYFQVVRPEAHLSSQNSHKTDLALLQLADADPPGGNTGAQVKQTAELAEARRMLETEQRAGGLANELAEGRHAMDGLNLQLQAEATAARQEQAASAVQYRQALDEERARSVTLVSELATAQREIEAQAVQLRNATEEAAQLKHAEAAKSAQALGDEWQKTAAIAQEATAARVELTASTGQHRQALDEERARSVALMSELVTAQRTIETQAAQLRKASDEISQKQAEAEKSAQSLEQERQRLAVLAQEVGAVRNELNASRAQHRQTLDEERARRAALWSELATAQREIEVLAAQLRRASEEAGQLRQATAELRQSLQQERDRTVAVARDFEADRLTVGARVTLEPAASIPISKAAQAVEVVAKAQPAVGAQGNPEATRLVARASALLGQGDIGGARIVLERAAETGSAQASFMLAETYDPGILSAWGTYGTRGEVTRARELYATALAGGIQEAKDRFDALRR
jgi:hypothetical protein